MGFDFSEMWETYRRMLDGMAAALPRFAVALVVFALFVLVGRMLRASVHRYAHRRGERRTLEIALGRLAQAGVLGMGVLVAATAAFPTFTPGDLVSTLGIGGVAIGFAFKDIFQNFLAGILILMTRPFRVGDQIVFAGYEGTVEEIQTRATYLKTYDGRRVVIPNGQLFTSAVTVNTAYPQRRFEHDFTIGHGDDVERAREVLLQVLRDAEGVLPDPVADVVVVDLAAAGVTLRARWWSRSFIVDSLVAQDRVLAEAKRRLLAAGIDIPYPTHQVLFHDQTEETDGDRSRQREGWPAGSGEPPRRGGIAASIARAREPGGRAGEEGTETRDGRTG